MNARLLAFALLLSGTAAMAGPRAFVSSTGDDANAAAGCSPVAPCRSFQAAHDIVDAGGEVVALDTAGYGRLLITKSVTIMANPGVVASITAPDSFSGVAINAPGSRVVLRGLNIVYTGSTFTTGVFMLAGDALSIENCVISGFRSQGVSTNGPHRLTVADTIIRSAGSAAILVTQGASAEVVRSRLFGAGGGEGVIVLQSNNGTTSRASVSDTVASGFHHGFAARSEATPNGPVRLSCIRCTASNNVDNGFHSGATTGSVSMMVSSSMASNNGQYGFFQQSLFGGTATFQSLGDNTLHGNGAGATSGTITIVGGN
jgi:hypothetical protein